MEKVALFVFNGDPMCFIHVLLNALDMKKKEYDIKTVIEGSAVKLIPELANEEHSLHGLWEKAKVAGVIEGVCRACSHKLGTLKDAEAQGLTLLEDMSGHPSIAGYRDAGYEVITF
jgi:hypothetical protein